MRRTAADRQAEVAGWRASGRSASAYAKARGIAQTTLARWAREVDAVPLHAEPAFLRVELAPAAELVVEVGAARLRVQRGFDPTLLAAVVAALGAGA
jgi:hypothetical protein